MGGDIIWRKISFGEQEEHEFDFGHNELDMLFELFKGHLVAIWIVVEVMDCRSVERVFRAWVS